MSSSSSSSSGDDGSEKSRKGFKELETARRRKELEEMLSLPTKSILKKRIDSEDSPSLRVGRRQPADRRLLLSSTKINTNTNTNTFIQQYKMFFNMFSNLTETFSHQNCNLLYTGKKLLSYQTTDTLIPIYL